MATFPRYAAKGGDRFTQSLSFIRQVPVELYPNKYRLAAALAYYVDGGDRSLAPQAQKH